MKGFFILRVTSMSAPKCQSEEFCYLLRTPNLLFYQMNSLEFTYVSMIQDTGHFKGKWWGGSKKPPHLAQAEPHSHCRRLPLKQCDDCTPSAPHIHLTILEREVFTWCYYAQITESLHPSKQLKRDEKIISKENDNDLYFCLLYIHNIFPLSRGNFQEKSSWCNYFHEIDSNSQSIIDFYDMLISHLSRALLFMCQRFREKL